MSYIGVIGVSNLDPGKVFDLPIAKQLMTEGHDPTNIKIQTGWEKGIDGLWRYEIADPFMNSLVIEDYVKPRFGQAINISMILRDTLILHAYPSLDAVTLYAMYSPRQGTAGYYNPATKGMVVSMGKPTDIFDYQIEGILLHELQHLMQEIEGFAKGGDPKTMGRRKYLRLAGEVEARNICHRHLLTEEERRRKLRTETQDIPDSQQIII